VVALAGRQPTLSQRVTKELLASMCDIRHEKGALLEVMRRTARALHEGGPAPTTLDPDGPAVRLPPAPSADAEVAAGRVREVLERLSQLIVRLVRAPRADRPQLLRQLMDTDDALFAAAERAASVYSDHYAGREREALRREHALNRKLQDGMSRMQRLATELQSGVAHLREIGETLQASAQAQLTEAEALNDHAEVVYIAAYELAERTEGLSTAAGELDRATTSGLETIESASQLSEEACRAMTELEARSHLIDRSLDTVAAVASQTKMLALNASIEAVRAGEAGRGFQVVANEVKDLAALSAQAAHDITEEIHEVRSRTTRTQTSMLKVVEAMSDVLQLSRRTKTTMGDQSQASESMAEAVTSAGRATERIARSSRQCSEAAQETRRQATVLAEFMNRLVDMSNQLGLIMHEVQPDSAGDG
jgi:methyl-accepting chemotaxis protein